MGKGLNELCCTIHQENNHVDRMILRDIIRNKYDKTHEEVFDTYFGEDGDKIKEEIAIEQDEDAYKNYCTQFLKMPVDEQMLELFSLFQVVYFGAKNSQVDEDLNTLTIEYINIVKSLLFSGWSPYEGLYTLTQTLRYLVDINNTIDGQQSRFPYAMEYLGDMIKSCCILCTNFDTWIVEVEEYIGNDQKQYYTSQCYAILMERFLTQMDIDINYKMSIGDITKKDYVVYNNISIRNYLNIGKDAMQDMMQIGRVRAEYYKDRKVLTEYYNHVYADSMNTETKWLKNKLYLNNQGIEETVEYINSFQEYLIKMDEAITNLPIFKKEANGKILYRQSDINDMIEKYQLDIMEEYPCYSREWEDISEQENSMEADAIVS